MTTNNSTVQSTTTPLLNRDDNSNTSQNEFDIDMQSSMLVQDAQTHVIKNKLGTINGCYVPCLLNILGIILFERLGWGIGQVGTAGVLAIFSIAEIQAILTVLSLSAIVTNGNMRGGGSYYMISRTLGPEFGGSIGILFYSAYCVGVAFYVTGFAEELVDTWFSDYSEQHWLIIGFASVLLAVAFGVAIAGANFFTKINVFLFFWQFLAQFLALLACFFRGTFAIETGVDVECLDQGNVANDDDYYHQSWSISRFSDAWSFSCPSCDTFAVTFGVLFPAVTGIMEGANLSGDLANPTYSIPVGTLSAVFTAITIYTLLVISFAGSFSPCVLREDTTIMQETAWGHIGTYLVVLGVIISASSSALGSLFGGSRVLQAIARDELFPYMEFFKYGAKRGDEPRVAVVFTWIIAQGLTFIGSINTIAPISTSFFCLSYATVNLSCFLLEISGTPNFRPSFTYYSWHSSLIGTILNLTVMFYVDYRFGTAALVCEIMVFLFLAYRAPQNVWGDVTQSVIFHQVRKYLLRLDERKMHSKLWRPSILLLADTEDLALIDFCNNLKKGGLYIIGTTIKGEFGDHIDLTQNVRRQWIDFIHKNKLKAFPQIAVAPNARNGFENLLLLSGLGAMQPNTVVIPLLRIPKKEKLMSSLVAEEKYDDDIAVDNEDIALRERKPSVLIDIPSDMLQLVQISPATMEIMEYSKLLRNILQFNRNIVLTHNFHKLDFELLVSKNIRNEAIANYSPTSENDTGFSFTSIKKSSSVERSIESNLWTYETNEASKDIGNQWVDVWLFASDYTFELNDCKQDRGFPMLMMQLAHILLQNKVWTKAAGLRVFLFTPLENWTVDDQNKFDSMLKELRLGVDQVVVLTEPRIERPSWKDIQSGKKKRKHMRRYYQTLNKTMVSLSSQTYFSFIRLPELPPERIFMDMDDEEEEVKEEGEIQADIQSIIKSRKDKKFDENRDGRKVDEEIEEHNLRNAMIFYESLYILLRGMPPTALVATGEELPVISMEI